MPHQPASPPSLGSLPPAVAERDRAMREMREALLAGGERGTAAPDAPVRPDPRARYKHGLSAGRRAVDHGQFE